MSTFLLIAGAHQCIQVAESELMDELKAIRKVLKKPALQYTAWNGEEVICHIVSSEDD